MSCNPIVKDDEVVGIVCSTSWGIGTYDAGEDYGMIYGFPPTGLHPDDFSPDIECCTPKEIAAWEKAKETGTRHGE